MFHDYYYSNNVVWFDCFLEVYLCDVNMDQAELWTILRR